MTTLPAARLFLLLLPIACVGLFARVLYTPDEPREASMVVTMATQPDKAVPLLGGRPFAEKPPLLYWLGGAAVAALGPTPAAARLPNLLYFLATAAAIGALAARAAGREAGFAAGFVAATALQSYQVLVWLATDAPLVAGVAIALYGSFAGLVAADAAARRHGYLLMYAGYAIAFFAKGFAGWMVPVLSFATVILSERRWRELLRAELWLGLPLLVLAIGTWVWAVARLAGGGESLRVLFWYNLVGRAVPLDAPAGLAYATGHRNSAGKYLLELPFYLLPWTPLAFAALRRAWRGMHFAGAAGTAWRLALGAIVPATLLLSLAATARGVYYGPPALGFALLIGLYVGSASTALDRTDRLCWRLTGLLVALLAVLLGALAAGAAFAPAWRDGLSMALGAVAIAAALLAAWLALSAPLAAAAALPRQALATTLVLTAVLAPLLSGLNGWLSLEVTARRLAAAAGGAPLVVLGADETTVAMVELYLPRAAVRGMLAGDGPPQRAAARRLLDAPDGARRVLWLVADRQRWGAGEWLGFLGYQAAPAAAAPPALPEGLGALRLDCLLTRPGGRSFALLARADAAAEPGAHCR